MTLVRLWRGVYCQGMPMPSLRVTVTLAIDVDRDAWDTAYGTGTKAADIRSDVREYILNAAQSLAPIEEGGITNVALKGR